LVVVAAMAVAMLGLYAGPALAMDRGDRDGRHDHDIFKHDHDIFRHDHDIFDHDHDIFVFDEDDNDWLCTVDGIVFFVDGPTDCPGTAHLVFDEHHNDIDFIGAHRFDDDFGVADFRRFDDDIF